MHEVLTIVTDVHSVCPPIRQSVMWGHSVQPLPNHFGFLFVVT